MDEQEYKREDFQRAVRKHKARGGSRAKLRKLKESYEEYRGRRKRAM